MKYKELRAYAERLQSLASSAFDIEDNKCDCKTCLNLRQLETTLEELKPKLPLHPCNCTTCQAVRDEFRG